MRLMAHLTGGNAGRDALHKLHEKLGIAQLRDVRHILTCQGDLQHRQARLEAAQ